MDLGIAQVGLSAADAHRLKTIMVMAVTSGQLDHRWVMGEMNDAVLVVTAVDSQERAALESAVSVRHGKILAVLAGESDEVPRGVLRLPWPIRLEGLIPLLKYVEKNAAKLVRRAERQTVPPSDAENHLLRLASMLRATEGSGVSAVWRVDGLSKQSLYVALGDDAFYYKDSLATLRNIDAAKKLEFIPEPVETLHARDGERPLIMLRWLVGIQTGAFGLLSWIDRDRAMRLKRYPAFQMLHHTSGHRRIAAALARPRVGVSELVQLTGENATTVAGFVNAAALCGYLVTDSAVGERTVSRKLILGPKRALIQSFRRALGIANANA